MSDYKQIQNTQSEGDFVLQGQELADKQDFRNVSKIWHDQTLSFDEALEKLNKERETQEDVLIKGKMLTPYFDEETGEVGIEDWDNDKRYRMTEHAWNQYATHCDVPTTYVKTNLAAAAYKQSGKKKYDRDMKDAETFYNVMLNGHRRIPNDRTFLIRTYDEQVCRAVLTDKYAPIDNAWFLETLSELLPGGRVSHWDKSNADTIACNILIPDSIRFDSDSDYGAMVSIGNSEIGTRTNTGLPSLFRAICMNGCIWGQEKGVCWSQVHRGKISMENLRTIMAKAIDGQIKLMPSIVDSFMATRQWELGGANVKQLATAFATENRLNKNQTISLFEGLSKETEHQNGFGFINGITRFSQSQDADTWQAYDTLAGDIVFKGKDNWDNFTNRAKNYGNEELLKILSKKDSVHEAFNLVAV